MNESNLDSLIYVSSAVKLLSLPEINHLLERARERNEEYGITGALLYIGGNFMQYLEGPAENLDIIYKIIAEDELHTGLILIAREAVEIRQFGDWSMAFQTRDVEGYVGSPGEKRLITTIGEIPEDNPTTARIVLQSFWDRGGS